MEPIRVRTILAPNRLSRKQRCKNPDTTKTARKRPMALVATIRNMASLEHTAVQTARGSDPQPLGRLAQAALLFHR